MPEFGPALESLLLGCAVVVAPAIAPVLVDFLPFIELFGEAVVFGMLLLVVVLFGTPLLCIPGVVEPVAFPAAAPVVCALARLVVAPMVSRRSAVEMNRLVMMTILVAVERGSHTCSAAYACELTAVPIP